MSDVIVTPRLRGEPLAEDDFDELLRLHRDEQVVAAFQAAPESAEETREFLDRKLAHWREHGFGIWMFRDADGRFAGWCGIHRWSFDGRGEVELGYVVPSDRWSQGYASEMGAALARHAYAALALPPLVAFTMTGNARSRRVLEKLGFRFDRTWVDEDGDEMVLYRHPPEGRLG